MIIFIEKISFIEMSLDLRTSELERLFMKERVSSIETHFLKISSKLSSYVNKLAALRDSGDEVAKSISDFASKEIYNQTLRFSLGKFSDVLSSLEEYRDAQVRRTEVKVIHELDNYNPICKQAKLEIKKCFDAHDKDLKRKADLDKLRSKNPHNWQKIEKAEKEVNQTHEEAARSTEQLSRQIEHFERKKLEDLKKVLLEFVRIEMIFHCKAIEFYTEANSILRDIKIEDDLNEFLSHFKAHESILNATTKPCSPQTSGTEVKPVDLERDDDSPPHKPLKDVQIRRRSVILPQNLKSPVKSSYSDGEDTDLCKSQNLKGIQQKQHSVFTMRNEIVDAENSSCGSRISLESKFVL